MDRAIEDWQSKKSLQESLFHIFETGLLADVAFLVGDEGVRILAHKCVLTSRSCVFERMFCGSLAESGDVSVPDISVPVFRDLMRFLYTDEVSVEASNVFPLLYAANKYSVERLEKKCVGFSKAGLTHENAFTFLQQGDIFDKQDLVEKAKKVILSDPLKCIKTEGFQNVSATWLQRFLSCENLNVSEIELFKAVVGWAKSECKRQNKSTSATELRSVLEEFLPLIRFPVMNQQDYLVVADSGILTSQELVDLFLHSVDNTRSPGAFASEKRHPDGTTMPVADTNTGAGQTPSRKFKEQLKITSLSSRSVELKAITFALQDTQKNAIVKISVTINGVVAASVTFEAGSELSKRELSLNAGTIANKESTCIVTYDMTPYHPFFLGTICQKFAYTKQKDDQKQKMTVVHTDPDSGQVIESGLVCGLKYTEIF